MVRLRDTIEGYQRHTGDEHPDPAWRPMAERPTSSHGLDLGAGRDPAAPPYDRGGRYGDLIPAEVLEDIISAT